MQQHTNKLFNKDIQQNMCKKRVLFNNLYEFCIRLVLSEPALRFLLMISAFFSISVYIHVYVFGISEMLCICPKTYIIFKYYLVSYSNVSFSHNVVQIINVLYVKSIIN